MNDEPEQARCECCGVMVPYWDLDCVTRELNVRRVKGVFVVDPRTIVRLECPDCREDDDG